MEFELPVHRLRFGLLEPERPDDFGWVTTPLRLHPAALDARHSALLRADLPRPPGAPPLSFGWRLVDAGGRAWKETTPRPAGRHPQTGLAEWLDTFGAMGHVATLQLVVVGIRAGNEAEAEVEVETVIDIVRLLPTLELGRVMTKWTVDETGSTLSLVWKAAASIRNRQVRLWPVDRPWETAPVTLAVPDEATDCAEWDLSADRLPPGEYLAEMIVHDPWDISTPVRPTPGAPNTFVLRPDDMDASLEAALTRARRDELPADEALAWIIFIARTDPGEAIARFNVTLWRERATLSMEQMLLWADAVRAVGDKTACQIVRKALFEPERIDRLADLAEDRRAAWLQHLPDDLDLAANRALLLIATGEARRRCLSGLCRAGDEAGYSALLDEVERATLTVDDAVEILRPAARAAADFLYGLGTEAAIEMLVSLLKKVHDDRFIMKGTDLQTNVGQVRVTGIRDLHTSDQRVVCRTGDDTQLLGKLWPYTSRLPITIDTQLPQIHVMKSPVFQCQIGGCDYIYADVKELNQHYKSRHGLIKPYLPGKTANPKILLTQMVILYPDGS